MTLAQIRSLIAKKIEANDRDKATTPEYHRGYDAALNSVLDDIEAQEEPAKELVEAYWNGVPTFKEFCEGLRVIAKNGMIYTTHAGREKQIQG